MSEIDLDYLREVLIPEAEKKLRKYKDEFDHSSIWGEKLEIHICRKWIYLKGERKMLYGGKGYVYLKINKEDQMLYSPSGKKGMCHYMDKNGPTGWIKKRNYFLQTDLN